MTPSPEPVNHRLAPAAGNLERLVLDALIELVAELQDEVPSVHLDSDFERDLGLDSLALAELLTRVEDAAGVALPTSLLGRVSTPRDLLRAVRPDLVEDQPAPVPLILSQQGGRGPRGLVTLLAGLAWHVAAHPDRLHVRILTDDETVTELTYGDLQHDATAVAHGILDDGVEPGEAVALMLPTGADYIVTFLGTLLAGAVPVPIYPPARPAQIPEHLERQSRILDNARAVLLITVPEGRRLGSLLRGGVPSLRHLRTPTRSAPRTGLACRPSTPMTLRCCNTPRAAPATRRAWCSPTGNNWPTSRPWPKPPKSIPRTCSSAGCPSTTTWA
jgi:non-ribosomal peptide synthetase component F